MSQSPFGLLTDWDDKALVIRVKKDEFVSIAFRLADGLGRLRRYGDWYRLGAGSQSPFGLLTDWDAGVLRGVRRDLRASLNRLSAC